MATQDYSQIRTIPDMLERTVALFPDRPAYSESKGSPTDWRTVTWKEFKDEVDRWKKALVASGLIPGDHVAILLPNSINAAVADQAILGSAMVPVPLHSIDTPSSSAYIINNSEAKLLIVPKTLRWNAITNVEQNFPFLTKVVVVGDDVIENAEKSPVPVVTLKEWLEAGKDTPLPTEKTKPEDLAAIVYTSGTTGKPKGVMLTHENIVANTKDFEKAAQLDETDSFLSYLPFSHTFERICTYYDALLIGAHVWFARNVAKLAEDLQFIKPTVFNSVPRVYEQFYQKLQSKRVKKGNFSKALADHAVAIGWRRFCRQNGLAVPSSSSSWLDPILWPILEKRYAQPVRDFFGGRLKWGVSGGAALNFANGTFFCGLGLPIFQGYGLTETTPVVCVNIRGMNNPITCGLALEHVEARIGENSELQVRGPSVMKGYWKLPEETAAVFTEDGWFRTGDQAEISDAGGIRINGLIKEIIVTSSGEKISPNDLELAILGDPLFEQIMTVGEGKPYITALAVVNDEEFAKLAKQVGADPNNPSSYERRDIRMLALKRIRKAAATFPQYGVPRNVWLLKDPWTVDNGLLTVTLKLRRRMINQRFKDQIEKLYQTPQANY
ncbi:MAG: long-chain fatty acid--CoA ligase [Burkholderiales bacterium]|nr:long-chain fatty acid--CoA ligase [Burkholderiales bacterium]